MNQCSKCSIPLAKGNTCSHCQKEAEENLKKKNKTPHKTGGAGSAKLSLWAKRDFF